MIDLHSVGVALARLLEPAEDERAAAQVGAVVDPDHHQAFEEVGGPGHRSVEEEDQGELEADHAVAVGAALAALHLV